LGYSQSNVHHTLFFKHERGKVDILSVYVDDIVMTGDDEVEITRMKGQLAKSFEGKLGYFLG
jgi:hypothetical protein